MVMKSTLSMTQAAIRRSVRVREGMAEMSRLVSAALVDQGFCRLLLSNPLAALSRGYNGETFDLSAVERSFVLSVQAESLTDFASRWVMLAGEHSATEDVSRPATYLWDRQM